MAPYLKKTLHQKYPIILHVCRALIIPIVPIDILLYRLLLQGLTLNGSEGLGWHAQRRSQSSQETVLSRLVRGPEPQHCITIAYLCVGRTLK